MFRPALLVGLALILVGAGYALGTGTQSITAWIPAFLGGAILAVGWLLCRVARPVQLLMAIAGVAGSAWRLVKADFDFAKPAVQAQGLTVLLCAILIVALLRRPAGANQG